MRGRRLPMLAVLAMAAIALFAVAGSAIGQSKKPTITIKGKNSYKINKYAKSALRFGPGKLTVKSGRTVSVKNPSNEPHSISVVQKKQLPKTTKQIDGCFEGICGQLAGAHEFPEGEGPPAKPLVNVGPEGFDRPGDSIVFNPEENVTFDVTAAKGKTLYYLCGFHPWMQGTIAVV
jgi:plastocyanin